MARQAPQLPSALGSSYAIQDADYTWHDGETPSARRGAVQVAVVCTPHSGHMLPVLHIAAELTRSGHRVTVYTADYAVRDFEKKVRQAGAAIHGLDMGGLTEEAAQQRAKAGKRIIFLVIKEAMTKPLREALQADRPSVVVSDFATWAGMEVAEELGIPLVINFPGPLALARDVLGLPSPSTAWSFCGFHFARNSLSPFSMALFANINQMGNFTRILRKHMAAGALVLVQTIWDLDAPQPLYPNIVVTGPVLPAATDLRQRLAKDHGELYRFLQAAGPEGVVYVSTGSLAELHKWQVEALYHGLKKTGARTVWSLKEKQQAFLPVRDDPDFYISKWTPQAELMQDSAVRCVITHCGWGGTLECMTAGKPVVCIPFFGDQPTNARLLQRAGAGELIGKIPNGTEGSQNPYKEGDFTPDTVAAAVGKVVGSPSYRDAVARMTRASRACGGAGMAVQQIEWAAWYGTGHLRSEAFLAVSGTSLWSAAALGAAGNLTAGSGRTDGPTSGGSSPGLGAAPGRAAPDASPGAPRAASLWALAGPPRASSGSSPPAPASDASDPRAASGRPGSSANASSAPAAEPADVDPQADETSCWTRNIRYDPIDMMGALVTPMNGIRECQMRCARVMGCAHFSYVQPGGDCHLQHEGAVAVASPGTTSGPPSCTQRLGKPCYEVSVVYFPTMPGLGTSFADKPGMTAVQVAKACKALCAAQEGCAHYMVQFPQRTCDFADANAVKVSRLRAVSGPSFCNRTANLQNKFASSAVAPGGGFAIRGAAAAAVVAVLAVAFAVVRQSSRRGACSRMIVGRRGRGAGSAAPACRYMPLEEASGAQPPSEDWEHGVDRLVHPAGDADEVALA